MSHLRHVGSLIALVIALAGVLGHACVVPGAAAVDHAAVQDHGHSHGHSSHPSDAHGDSTAGVHAAFCEATVSTPAPVSGIAGIALRGTPRLAPTVVRTVEPLPLPVVVSRPPLYVIHTAFLI